MNVYGAIWSGLQHLFCFVAVQLVNSNQEMRLACKPDGLDWLRVPAKAIASGEGGAKCPGWGIRETDSAHFLLVYNA